MIGGRANPLDFCNLCVALGFRAQFAAGLRSIAMGGFLGIRPMPEITLDNRPQSIRFYGHTKKPRPVVSQPGNLPFASCYMDTAMHGSSRSNGFAVHRRVSAPLLLRFPEFPAAEIPRSSCRPEGQEVANECS